eukprot:a843198_516.p1 GENE.a843198_516~~a843198_516.p1  ORF type:complete len:204 (+),score=47.74 a843198_516:34-612(+)
MASLEITEERARVRIAASATAREAAKVFFAEGSFGKALMEYHKAYLQLKGLVARKSADGDDGMGGFAGMAGLSGATSAPLPEALQAEISESELKVLSNMAICLSKLGRTERVIEVCKDALAIDPTDPKVNYRIGAAYLALSKIDKAEEHLKIAARALPDDPNIRRDLKALAVLQKKGEADQRAVLGGWADKL